MSNTMIFIRTLLFSFLVGGGLVFQSAAPAFGQSDILLQLRGGKYVLDHSASDRIDQAIQTAVIGLPDPSSMVWYLKNSNTPSEHVVLTLATNEVNVKFDSQGPLRSPINGQAVRWTREGGKKYNLTSRVERGILVQTLTRDGETITRTYTEDAKALTIRVEVTSPRLPRPLTYKLVYNRAS